MRDWIHVDDLIAGALAVVEADERKPVNLCSGDGTSFNDLAMMFIEAAGYQTLLDHDTDAPTGVRHRVGDPTRMRQIYTPTVSLAEGIRRSLETDR